jgi:V/A-type H+-transporting ATPase subunit C
MTFPSGGRIAESSKARIRKGTLLSGEDLRLLLEQTSVGGIALRLRESPYAAVLESVSLEDMRRSELEFLLNVSILADGVAFRHYADQGDRKFLDLWLESFDIALIKEHIRFMMRGEGAGKFFSPEPNPALTEWDHLSPDRMLDRVSDFHLTLVDQEKLLSGSSLRDILASVKKDALRAALSEAVPAGFESGGSENAAAERGPGAPSEAFQKTMFALGMILDRWYFNALYAAAAVLGGEEGRMMRALVGTRIDLLNLYWIYRARRFFRMSPEEALTLILKARYRADFELLTKAAFVPVLEGAPYAAAFAPVLEGTPYAAVFSAADGAADDERAALHELAVERRIYKLLLAVVNRVFLSGALGFQNVAAYLTLKEFEVRDIIAIVEAVRYGFDKSKIDLILIRPLGKGVN